MSNPERDYDDFDLPGCEEYYDEGDLHDAEPAEPEEPEMCNTTDPNEFEHFPCDCHRPEYACEGMLCPACQAERDALDRDAEEDQREREWLEREAQEADLNNQHFADACGMMTRDDWDADNDWLASAGWSEM